MVVDDDEAVRDSLSILLSLAGHSIHALTSGSALLDWIDNSPQTVPADCFILDVHMPYMSGLDLMENLKQQGCHVPVIFISGNIDIATRERATQLGVFHLLEKPFSDDLLFDAIREVTG